MNRKLLKECIEILEATDPQLFNQNKCPTIRTNHKCGCIAFHYSCAHPKTADKWTKDRNALMWKMLQLRAFSSSSYVHRTRHKSIPVQYLATYIFAGDIGLRDVQDKLTQLGLRPPAFENTPENAIARIKWVLNNFKEQK